MKYIYIIIIFLFLSCSVSYSAEKQIVKACEFIKIELIDSLVGYSNMMQNYEYNNAKNVIDNKYKLAQIYSAICIDFSSE